MASYLSTLRNRVRPGGASTSAPLALAFLLAAGGQILAPSAWAAKPAAGQPAPAAKTVSAKGKDDCSTGRSQYAGGDVLRAIASLERCLDREPRNRAAWATLATALLEAGRFPDAADAYAKAHSIRPGDAPFLVSYLDALEGAGRAVERVAVLRSLTETGPDGVRYAGKLLALVDSLGAARHAGDRLHALEKLSLRPDAEIRHQEKLAAAYLESGLREKAQAEYRGLISRKPEKGEYWGGLAASISKEDPAAALECYRKAIFFSDQAQDRAAFEKAVAALKAGSDKAAGAKADADKAVALKAADDKAAQEKAAQERQAREKSAQEKVAKEKAAQPKTAAAPPSKPFDIKAFQDSVFKAELQKRLAALKQTETASGKPGAATPPSVATGPRKDEQEKKAEAEREEREKRENLAREEKEKQERLAKETAKKAEEERKHREKQARDSLGRVESERLAKEKAARELRDRFVKDSLAQAEKERLAKVEAEKRRKVEEENARRRKEEQGRHVRDSLAKVERERFARLESERKANEARDRFVKDSLAKAEKERLAKLEEERKANEAHDRVVKDSLAKAEKMRLAKLEEERKAKEARDRFVRDSLAKVEKERLAKLEEERKAKEARDRFVKDSLAKVEQQRLARLEVERKAREAREKFVKDSLRKVELERLARLEAERKAKEEQERKERLAREKQERHDRAIAHYKSGRIDSAEALFGIVLEETPSPDAVYYAGRVHLERGRADKALGLLLKVPKDRPDLDGFLGRAYLKTGKKQEALEALERHFAKTSDLGALEDICALRKASKDQGPWAACMEKLAGKRPMVGRYQEELAVHYRIVGEKGKSLERWSKLLLLEPSHGEANYQLGMDWGSQGVHDRAVPCLEKALAAFPERSEAWKLLAKGQAATGRRSEAWKSYGKAATLLPKDLDVARGRLALAKDPGREADLPGAYLAVLKLVPTDGEANLGYARLRFAAKDYPAAEKHFRAGLGESKEAAAWGQYGRSLLETGKLDEAAVALQKALDLGETSTSLKLDLARLHLDKGDADKAEVLVKQISSRHPADPEPYFWLARIAEKRQQAAVQEEFLRKAHQLKTDEVRYSEPLARLFKERDEFKQAIGVLGPNEARLTHGGKMLFADCLAATGEGRRALEIYTALYRAEPGPTLLAHRIDALVRMGKAGEAVDAARGTAFADNPEVQYSVARAHLSLSESHVLKGDLDLAIALLKKALDADGHRPEFHFHLGRAYHMRGKPGKARDAYTDALRYRVEYPDAVYWKGMSLVEDGKALAARDFFGELSQHADLRWKARGLMGLARVFEAEGKWEAVEHHLQRSIATLPNAEAMAYLSRVNFRLGRLPEAEDWARKALALDAGYEEGTMALAEALAARKKIPEALGLASAALRVKPLSCDLLVQSAKLNLEAGRFDSTLTTTVKAIEVCPGEPLPYFYAGMAMRGHNKPEDAKRHFKSFRKLGGDSKMLPE